MSEGLTVDSNFGGKLAAFHGATLGQYGLTNGYYYKAIQWLEFALYQLHEDHDSNSSISEELVGNILQVAVQTVIRFFISILTSHLATFHSIHTKKTST